MSRAAQGGSRRKTGQPAADHDDVHALFRRNRRALTSAAAAIADNHNGKPDDDHEEKHVGGLKIH